MPKIIPYRYYRAPNGARVSIYSSYVPPGSELVHAGYTILWPDGTSGCGRPPFESTADAEQFLKDHPKFRGMGALAA